MTVIKLNVPSQGYRRFLSPDEIRARREAEARGVLAEVERMREDQASESRNSEISPSLNNTSATGRTRSSGAGENAMMACASTALVERDAAGLKCQAPMSARR